ncbi:TIGR03905 family TSCPD domain-containing protein [Intestinibacter sp.]
MKINFKTSGVCCREMNLVVDENNIITDVEFVGGCDGNLSGIAKLVVGLNALDVAQKLEGTTCGSKMTSCPDQLSRAIRENLK